MPFGDLIKRVVVQGDKNAKEAINRQYVYPILDDEISDYNQKCFPPIQLNWKDEKLRWAKKVSDPVIKFIKDYWLEPPPDCSASFRKFFTEESEQKTKPFFEQLIRRFCKELVGKNAQIQLTKLEKQLKRREIWRRCWAKLNPTYREAIFLTDHRKKTLEVCAAKFRMGVQAFSKMLDDATVRFRHCLESHII